MPVGRWPDHVGRRNRFVGSPPNLFSRQAPASPGAADEPVSVRSALSSLVTTSRGRRPDRGASRWARAGRAGEPCHRRGVRDEVSRVSWYDGFEWRLAAGETQCGSRLSMRGVGAVLKENPETRRPWCVRPCPLWSGAGDGPPSKRAAHTMWSSCWATRALTARRPVDKPALLRRPDSGSTAGRLSVTRLDPAAPSLGGGRVRRSSRSGRRPSSGRSGGWPRPTCPRPPRLCSSSRRRSASPPYRATSFPRASRFHRPGQPR